MKSDQRGASAPLCDLGDEFVHAIELYCLLRIIWREAGPRASRRADACRSCAGMNGIPTEKGRAAAEWSAQRGLRAGDDGTLDDHKSDRVARRTSVAWKQAERQDQQAGYPNRIALRSGTSV